MSSAYTIFGELRADTSQFQSALRQAEDRLKSTERAITATENRAKSLGQSSAVSARGYEKLNDAIGTQREKLNQAADAFRRGDISAKQFAASVNQVGNSTSIINSKLKDTQARLTDFATRATDVAGKMRSLGTGMTNVGQALFVAMTVPLLGLGVAAVKTAADFQSLRAGLTAVMGDAGKAAAHFERLKEVAKLPGLGLKEALEGSTNLQAAGLSADSAERALKAFGNALATVGKGKAELSGVITALSQIQSKGKVSAEEINQLAERLPQIRVAMKDAFGTSDTEALQKMGIDSKTFIEKMIASFEKLPAVNQTAKASFENFADSVSLALLPLGDAILPVLMRMGEIATPIIEKVSAGFASLSPTIQMVVLSVAGIATAMGPVLIALGMVIPAIATIISGVAGAVAAVGGLAPLIGIVAAGIAGLAIQMAPAIAIAAAMFAAWQTNFGHIKELVSVVSSAIKIAWFSAMTAITNLTSELTTQVAQFWSQNGEDIKKAVQKVSDNITLIWTGLVGFWMEHGETIKSITSAVWGAVSSVDKSAVNIILNVIKGVAAVINGDWSKSWEAAKAIFSSVWSAIAAIGNAQVQVLIGVVKAIFAGIATLHGWVLGKAAELGMALINGIKNAILSGASSVVNAVKGMAESVISSAKSVLQIHSPSRVFFAIGKDTVQGYIDGINALKASGQGAIADLLDISKLGGSKGNKDIVSGITSQLNDIARFNLATKEQAAVIDLTSTKFANATKEAKDFYLALARIQDVQAGGDKWQSGVESFAPADNSDTGKINKLLSDSSVVAYLKSIGETAESARLKLVGMADALKLTDAAEKLAAEIDSVNESALSQIGTMQKELDLRNAISELAKMQYETTQGIYKDADADIKKKLVALAQEKDAVDALKASEEERKSLIDAGKSTYESLYASLREKLFGTLTLSQQLDAFFASTAGQAYFASLGISVESARASLQGLVQQLDILEFKGGDFGASLIANIQKMGEGLGSVTQVLGGGLTNAIQGVGTVFANAVTQWDGTAKGFFKSIAQGFAQMAQQIIAELIRIMIIKAIVGIAGAIAGGAAGGMGGGSTSSMGGGDVGFFGGAGIPIGRAEGGFVSGKGTSTSDSIAAWLSNGEFVMNAKSVKKYGTDFFEQLNSPFLPRFAGGGLVGSTIGGATTNYSTTNSPVTVNMTVNAQDAASFQRSKTQMAREMGLMLQMQMLKKA